MPPNVRLQPGNEDERRSNMCVSGDPQMSSEDTKLIDTSSEEVSVDPDTGMPIHLMVQIKLVKELIIHYQQVIIKEECMILVVILEWDM